MKKIYFLIIILLFNFYIVNAENSLTKNQKIINYGLYRGIILDVGGLNNILENKGYPKLNSFCTSMGIGNHNIINDNIIFGINFYKFYGNQTENDRFITKLQGNWELFSVGLTILSGDNYNLYPIINAGYGTLEVKIIENTINDFDKILNQTNQINQIDGVTLETSSYLFEPAIGFDYFMDFKFSTKLYAGFRAGYMFSPINYGWTVNGISITGGPKTSITGPFFSISGGIVF